MAAAFFALAGQIAGVGVAGFFFGIKGWAQPGSPQVIGVVILSTAVFGLFTGLTGGLLGWLLFALLGPRLPRWLAPLLGFGAAFLTFLAMC